MAHKTFISYKWSEAQDLRDDIITALAVSYTHLTLPTNSLV